MLNSKGNHVRFLNFVSLYQTPHGLVNNGYTHEKYREIFLNARTLVGSSQITLQLHSE